MRNLLAFVFLWALLTMGVSAEQDALYGSFAGTVKEGGEMLIFVENEQGDVVTFRLEEDTYFITRDDIAIGDRLIGFYDAKAPVIMIYPPQYKAEALAVNFPEQSSVKMDIFDENFVSSDGNLKLNISETTEIILQDGTAFDMSPEELANKRLVVEYDITTRSIPAQTNPTKIVVLLDKAQPPALEAPVQPEENVLVVNQTEIEAPEPYVLFDEDNNTIFMIPLRAVAEALGYEVQWDGEKRSVRVGDDIEITIDADAYSKGEIISMPIAAKLSNDTTYVPLSFFKNLVNNAYVFEGQIVIDNEEIMQ